MKIAYLDCFSGISGDMFLGALIDCGLSRTLLKRELSQLNLGSYAIKFSSEKRMSITGCRVEVKAPQKKQKLRTLTDIKRILTKSPLNQQVKKTGINVFQQLARAESKIHQRKTSQIHFHEVGAIDSIVDIVGVALGIDYFALDKLCASPVPLGSGLINCQHGVIPLPSPATLELLQGIPVYGTSLDGELVTPTGAALLSSLASSYGPMPPLKIISIGYGVGRSNFNDRPNVLRLVIGELTDAMDSDQVAILETNIDDMIPELYDYLMEQLFAQGALDVFFTPIHMKKNRPGVLLNVICTPDKKDELSTTIFRESTSTGIRCSLTNRIKLKRTFKTITTPYGKLNLKVFMDTEGKQHTSLEYEQCKKVAKKFGVPLKEVYLELVRLLPSS